LHVNIDRDACETRLSGYEHELASFILHEIQEVILTIHFKLQFLFSMLLNLGGSETRPYTVLLKADSLFFVFYVYVLGVDHTFVLLLTCAVCSRRRACSGFRSRRRLCLG